MSKKKALPAPVKQEEASVKDFFDLVSPGVIKFNPDYYIIGDTYRCVWVIREYPPITADQAILARFGDKEGVTLHVYSRYVDNGEQRKIIQNATRKNRMMTGGTDIQDTVTAEGNLEDVVELLANMRKNKEPLLHSTCSYRSRERPNRKSIKKNVTPANFMSVNTHCESNVKQRIENKIKDFAMYLFNYLLGYNRIKTHGRIKS